jgi:hypothetical protein
MERIQYRWLTGIILAASCGLAALGCYHSPVDVSESTQGPAPLRVPAAGPESKSCGCYKDSLTGGQIFEMYCGYCHNARSLAERPFSNYKNVAQHMRVRANIPGEDYAKLVAWMRRWSDVPSPEQSETPAPNRFIFSQPINELRQHQPKTAPDLPGGPRPGATSEASPGQPAPGNSPQEAR